MTTMMKTKKRSKTKWPIVSDDHDQQRHYERMRAAGESHSIAEMVALAKAPSDFGTDRRFWIGKVNENQFANCPEQGRYLRRVKKTAKAGVSGKYYHNQLGEWVGGLDDIKAIARARGNLDVTDNDRVLVRGVHRDPPPEIPLSENIIREHMYEKLTLDPGQNTPDGRKKLRSEILERHTPSAKKKLIKE